MSSLLVVGGGRMGAALVGGLIRSGAYLPSQITVADPDPGALERVQHLGAVVVSNGPVAADGAVLAIKPSELERACGALAAFGVERVLSIVAGATTATIERYLGPASRVVRSMPNTPALVGAGASAIAGGASATADDLAWAEAILGAVGVVVQVSESSIDAVTGLSGSGPAYVFLVVEALCEAGVLAGLDRTTSTILATETLRGAAELLSQSGESAAALRAQVTSPGGTTAAGLRVLEQRGVRAAMLDAVAAATERSRELGTSS
jgi:pyrroline-5-carboxylate reductase